METKFWKRTFTNLVLQFSSDVTATSQISTKLCISLGMPNNISVLDVNEIRQKAKKFLRN